MSNKSLSLQELLAVLQKGEWTINGKNLVSVKEFPPGHIEFVDGDGETFTTLGFDAPWILDLSRSGALPDVYESISLTRPAKTSMEVNANLECTTVTTGEPGVTLFFENRSAFEKNTPSVEAKKRRLAKEEADVQARREEKENAFARRFDEKLAALISGNAGRELKGITVIKRGEIELTFHGDDTPPIRIRAYSSELIIVEQGTKYVRIGD